MKKILNIIFLIILILSIIFNINISCAKVSSSIEIESKPNADVSSLSIYTNCIMLIEPKTGDILYEKNGYEKMYPASTTKILTAILVLENSYLNELTTVSSTALNSVPAGYTIANLKKGEKFRIEDLLYAMLIPSGNDAANVLAEHVSGSISSFSELMNKKAEAIGLKNSHFTNPSGIHDENLYTTAYDLCLLSQYAMNNEKFREIVKTPKYTLPSTSIHPEEDRIFYNSNLLLDPKQTDYYYKYANGIKTGFTDQAGDCLVASSKKDDIEFIVVCLKSGTQKDGLREKFLDCKTLFDFAFDNYTTYYRTLQDVNKKEELSQIANEQYNSVLEQNIKTDFSFLRFLIKIIALIIILFAIKILFFRKKKNRRRKLKKRK